MSAHTALGCYLARGVLALFSSSSVIKKSGCSIMVIFNSAEGLCSPGILVGSGDRDE